MNANLSTLPAVKTAKLPVSYETAKAALANCARIDECAEWASKAEAIASYARQAEDETLLNTATRIKARAIQRCGQLLKAIAPAKGANQNIRGGAPPNVVTRASAAREAGLSKDQQKQAQRVASIPKDTFEKLVESPKPPTVTALAGLGKKPAPPPKAAASTAHLKGRDPKEFAASTQVQGSLRLFAEMATKSSVAVAVRGAMPRERRQMAAHAKVIEAWITRLQAELEKTHDE
jgi:hypothetical protein